MCSLIVQSLHKIRLRAKSKMFLSEHELLSVLAMADESSRLREALKEAIGAAQYAGVEEETITRWLAALAPPKET